MESLELEAALSEEPAWFVVGGRDCWPFVRIVIVAAVAGAAAHYLLGWRIDASHLIAAPGRVLGVLSLLAMISFALAELYLLLLAIPLYVLAVVNDWSYGAAVWAARTILRVRSAAALALLGIAGEIALFGLFIQLLSVLWRR